MDNSATNTNGRSNLHLLNLKRGNHYYLVIAAPWHIAGTTITAGQIACQIKRSDYTWRACDSRWDRPDETGGALEIPAIMAVIVVLFPIMLFYVCCAPIYYFALLKSRSCKFRQKSTAVVFWMSAWPIIANSPVILFATYQVFIRIWYGGVQSILAVQVDPAALIVAASCAGLGLLYGAFYCLLNWPRLANDKVC